MASARLALLRTASSSAAAAAFIGGARPTAPRPPAAALFYRSRRAGLSTMMNAGGEPEGSFVGSAATGSGGSSTEEAEDFFRTGLPPIPFPKEFSPLSSPSASASASSATSTSSSTGKKKGSGSKPSRPSKRDKAKPSLPPQPLPGIAGALPNKSGNSSSSNATATASNAGDRTVTSSSGISVNIPGGVFGSASAAAAYSSPAYRNPGLFPTHARAAVAVTIATKPSAFDKTTRYCLVKRGKDPGKGQWSLPGGSIELGEETLRAAAREAAEETGLTKEDLRFYPHTICTTDAIYRASGSESGGSGGESDVKFHYLIAQHAAWINSGAVERAKAGDDAEELRFCTLEEIKQMTLDGSLVGNVVEVVLRVEKFITKGIINLDFDLVELQ